MRFFHWLKAIKDRTVLRFRTKWFILGLNAYERNLEKSDNPLRYISFVNLMIVRSILEKEGLEAAQEAIFHPEVRRAREEAKELAAIEAERRGMQVHITEPIVLGNGIIQEPLTAEDLEILRRNREEGEATPETTEEERTQQAERLKQIMKSWEAEGKDET
jgi:hypothetical protein